MARIKTRVEAIEKKVQGSVLIYVTMHHPDGSVDIMSDGRHLTREEFEAETAGQDIDIIYVNRDDEGKLQSRTEYK